MFAHSVITILYACLTSHVASCEAAFYFSFAKLVQAAFCKYWSSERNIKMKACFQFCIAESRQYSAKPSTCSYSCTKITAAFLILYKIRYSMIFAGNSLHLHAFSLPTLICT
jgi:hypothetical protein